uniref:Uncharacterized protein n=1 Tax=Moniliophthora roreri TaxID=221103 RepID=A0A0W0GE32_MONRR
MAIINISTIIKYNKPNSVLKQCSGVAPQDAATWVIAKKEKDGDCMDMDKDSKARAQITPPVSDAEQDVVGVPSLAVPEISCQPPYLIVILMFLAALEVMERFIPWEDLAAFCAATPRSVMQSQDLLGDHVVLTPDDTNTSRCRL